MKFQRLIYILVPLGCALIFGLSKWYVKYYIEPTAWSDRSEVTQWAFIGGFVYFFFGLFIGIAVDLPIWVAFSIHKIYKSKQLK